MCSGKTMVARLLAEHGWIILDLDCLVKTFSQKGRAIWKMYVQMLGRFCLDRTGALDRARIGWLVFRNRKALLIVNRFVHPLLRQQVQRCLSASSSRERIIVEGAILLEAGFLPLLDILVFVEAGPELRIRRLVEKGCPEREAIRRVHSQIFLPALQKRSQLIIYNTGTPGELERSVERLAETLKNLEPRGVFSPGDPKVGRFGTP